MTKPSTSEATSFSQMLTLESVSLYPLRAADGVSPSMALGTMPTRPALLISVKDTHGACGWGEVWANFPPRANIHKAHLIEDVVAPKLNGFSYTDPRELDVYLRDALGVYFLHIGQERVFEHILAGLDTALWDLALRSANQSFAEHMGIAAQVKSYASSINPQDLDSKFQVHGALGQTAFKLKLGFGDDADVEFVKSAAAKCSEAGCIMVDSNQKWTPQQAQTMLKRLDAFSLRFAEEPIPANAPLTAWEQLAKATDTPLAAGENVYGIDEFLSLADAGVAYLQPDVAKWGGVSGALDLAAALPSSARLWPHFMGTAVGQIAALSITGSAGDGSVCEMDVNTNPLRTDLCGDVLTIVNGCVTLPSAPGLVVAPDPEQLRSFTDVAFSDAAPSDPLT